MNGIILNLSPFSRRLHNRRSGLTGISIILTSVENIIICFISLAAEVSIAICSGNSLMPRQYLRKFQIALGKVGHGYKIMAEVMNTDRVTLQARFLHAFLDSFPHSTGCVGADGFYRMNVLTGKQWLG